MAATPDFGRSVNPISTKGAYYAHQITTGRHLWIFRPSYGPVCSVERLMFCPTGMPFLSMAKCTKEVVVFRLTQFNTIISEL